MVSRVVRFRIVGAAMSLLLAANASAQAPTAPVAPSAPSSGGSMVVDSSGSGMYVEWGVTAIGVAAAMFAVCRSGQRS